jgi:dTDP-4-dehydrorhamnose reductase
MRVFITGGSGFLGRHLLRALRDRGWTAIAPTSTDLDIRDSDSVNAAIKASDCQAVVHLAYRYTGWDVNVDGTRNVARAAASAGARMVHLSTDVVFCDRREAYTELDKTCPLHVYGRSKAAAELAVTAEHPEAVIVRTSLLYGIDDLASIQHEVANALTGGSAMRFFTDEVRCPIYAGDLSTALLDLIDRHPNVSGPLHIAGPEAMTRQELAHVFARHLGFDPSTVPSASARELGMDKVRPLRVVLDCSRARALGIFACSPASILLD